MAQHQQQQQPHQQPHQQPQQQPHQQPHQQPQQEQLLEATALQLPNSVVAGAATQSAAGAVPQTETPAPAPALTQEPNASVGSACGNNESGSVAQGGSSGCGVDATQLGSVLLPGAGPESIQSTNELGNACRICRVDYSDVEIINCPCNCKGSVGYIHMRCLKRWIIIKRNNHCEICNSPFNITEDRASLKQMLRAFFCGRCCGMIVKHVLFSASLMPLAHVILQQVLHCMDNLNQGSTEQLTVQEVFVASCALLTSSALFFHFFEFVTTRFLLIRNILRHWWMFGSTNDFAQVDVEDDAFDLF